MHDTIQARVCERQSGRAICAELICRSHTRAHDPSGSAPPAKAGGYRLSLATRASKPAIYKSGSPIDYPDPMNDTFLVVPDKAHRFRSLCTDAQLCQLCPSLADKTAVLSDLNGRLDPKVFF